MLSDKLQKSKQVGNSIDLPIPVESAVQTLHLNRSKFERKKWGNTSYRIYTFDHETKLRLNGRYFTSTVLLIVHQSHRKFNNVRPLITLSLLFMTHETIIRFSLYLIAIKLLASAFFPQTFRLLFELAIFAIDFLGFSKEYAETVVSIWLFFISACVVLIMYEIFFHLFFQFFLLFSTAFRQTVNFSY